jgi:hypothetical protein
MKYILLLLLACALPVQTLAQTPPETRAPAPLLTAPALLALPAMASKEVPQAEALPQGCSLVTDKAMATDLKAATAQSKKSELIDQVELYEAAIKLWASAIAQCEGRAKDRAQRNLTDNQKTLSSLKEQLGAGPQCAAAHKDAATLQDLARQAIGERKWNEASVLFRKAENMWDVASERCSGTQQDTANRRRDQSETDGHNAEHCAPWFEQAREQTQKLRTLAAGMPREEKQEASLVAETLWREAVGQCKGAVQDTARSNAQAIARERGTPWVARALPKLPNSSSKTSDTPPAVKTAAVPLPSASKTATLPVSTTATAVGATLLTGAAVSTVDANGHPKQAEAQPEEFTAGNTTFKGSFVRDAGSATFSGKGKLVWSNGDSFDGTLVKGQRHGRGLFVWANGQRYHGDWFNDKPQGEANMQFANGNQYEGQVFDGLPQDKGQMRYASGDTYTGQFNRGEPQGRGVYLWQNGQQFDGDWKLSQPNGEGQLKFATGNVFEGTVVNGIPNGQGRLVYATGETYVGQFTAGEPNGLGSYEWKSGDTYTGLWKSGKKHGHGRFSWKTGEIWEGVYEDDVQTVRDK